MGLRSEVLITGKHRVVLEYGGGSRLAAAASGRLETGLENVVFFFVTSGLENVEAGRKRTNNSCLTSVKEAAGCGDGRRADDASSRGLPSLFVLFHLQSRRFHVM
jgi:hypothetical protein